MFTARISALSSAIQEGSGLAAPWPGRRCQYRAGMVNKGGISIVIDPLNRRAGTESPMPQPLPFKAPDLRHV